MTQTSTYVDGVALRAPFMPGPSGVDAKSTDTTESTDSAPKYKIQISLNPEQKKLLFKLRDWTDSY